MEDLSGGGLPELAVLWLPEAAALSAAEMLAACEPCMPGWLPGCVPRGDTEPPPVERGEMAPVRGPLGGAGEMEPCGWWWWVGCEWWGG
jgi:hypothetical protein